MHKWTYKSKKVLLLKIHHKHTHTRILTYVKTQKSVYNSCTTNAAQLKWCVCNLPDGITVFSTWQPHCCGVSQIYHSINHTVHSSSTHIHMCAFANMSLMRSTFGRIILKFDFLKLWYDQIRIIYYICIKLMLEKESHEIHFTVRDFRWCFFFALGTARLRYTLANMHAGMNRRTHTHSSVYNGSGLTFPCTLLSPRHSSEIALQWLVDVAAHKLTATPPKASLFFHAKQAFLGSLDTTHTQAGKAHIVQFGCLGHQ